MLSIKYKDDTKQVKTREQYLEHLKKHELTWISERAVGKYLKPYPLSVKILFNFLFTLNPCFPSYSYIISETPLCDNKALKKALDGLKKAEILDWKKGSKLGEKGRSNLYIFNYELLADLSIQYQNRPFISAIPGLTIVQKTPSRKRTIVQKTPSDHSPKNPTKESIVKKQTTTTKETDLISSSSSFDQVIFSDYLLQLGVNPKSVIKQVEGQITAEELQTSLLYFEYTIKNSKKVYTNPQAYLVKAILKGGALSKPKNYMTEEESIKAKRIEEERQRLIDKQFKEDKLKEIENYEKQIVPKFKNVKDVKFTINN
jgi:hypothetical protein